MSSSTISEGILLIAVVISAATISFNFFNSITDIGESSKLKFQELNDKIDTSIEIIHIQKSSNNSITVWLKNTGKKVFSSSEISQGNILFGRSEDSIDLYAFSKNDTSWSFNIEENKKYWFPGDTLEIMLETDQEIQSGGYFFSFITYLGTSHRNYFSIGD